MSDWKPIKTAHRGTGDRRLLLTDGVHVSTGLWNGDEWTNESELVWRGWSENGSMGYAGWEPTHWMPLPEPPK